YVWICGVVIGVAVRPKNVRAHGVGLLSRKLLTPRGWKLLWGRSIGFRHVPATHGPAIRSGPLQNRLQDTGRVALVRYTFAAVENKQDLPHIGWRLRHLPLRYELGDSADLLGRYLKRRIAKPASQRANHPDYQFINVVRAGHTRRRPRNA